MINTKSSTKAELVAMNNVMPLILWTQYFLEAQGYEVHKNKVFQDNKRTLLLEKNGKCLISCWICHITILYFFVTDWIQSKEVAIEYCPTDEMLAHMFTKPLQGAAFHKFQATILNLQDDEDICPAMVPMSGHRSVLGKVNCTQTNSRQTRESDGLDGTKQMVEQVAKANVANVETKN